MSGKPDGKLRIGACGHAQRAVFNQLFLCIGARNCNGKPAEERCKKCGSTEVEPFSAPMLPPGAFRCVPCGAAWRPPVAAEQ